MRDTTQTAATTIERTEVRRTISPYDLTAADNPGAIISYSLLKVNNYDEWACNMKTALLSNFNGGQSRNGPHYADEVNTGMIEVREGSWFEPLKGYEGKLVSNPPYIPSDDIQGLQAEVGKHEPILALDGGVNGTDSLFHLCHEASKMLKRGGFFVFETNGEKQSKMIVDYMTNELKNYISDLKIVSDFAGIDRFVIGFRL